MFELEGYVQKVQTKLITSGTDTYICNADIGSEETSYKWNIYKVDEDGNKKYAISKKDGLPTLNKQFLPSEYDSLEYGYGRYTTSPIVSFTINGGDLITDSLEVALDLTIDSYVDIVKYFVSESDKLNLTEFTTKEPTSFTLSEGYGEKNLYLWVMDGAGNISSVATASILYNNELPITDQIVLENNFNDINGDYYTNDSGIITWEEVENATGYKYQINTGDIIDIGNTLSFNVSELNISEPISDQFFIITITPYNSLGDGDSDSVEFTYDNIDPELVGDTIPSIAAGGSGQGTLNFSEDVILDGLELVTAADSEYVGGEVIIDSGDLTQELIVTIIIPNLLGSFKIIGTIIDKAGNSSSLETSVFEVI